MRAPLGELPRQLDRYVVLEELGTHTAGTDGLRHLLARNDTTGRLEVLMAVLSGPEADDEGYRLRFWAEAGKSRRMTGRWAASVSHVASQQSPLPWVAYDCGPALPLPAVLAAQGGPLPEGLVRAWGAALTETLLDGHRNGLVHAGISPETVFVTPSGPLLTGFGLVRAASPGGARRDRVPGVAPENLPPEQRAGESPQPLGDVYALATVLAYAATGVRDPAAHRIPVGLRPVLTACLAQDPEARPQSDALLSRFGAAGDPATGGTEPPAGVQQALGTQVDQHGSTAPSRVPEQPGASRPDLPSVGSGSAETRSSPLSPARRTLLTGAVYGALGVGVGGGAVLGWRASRPDPEPPRDPLAVHGGPPAPLWHYSTGGGAKVDSVVPVGRRLAVVSLQGGSVIGLDLTTGKRLWSRDDMYLDAPPVHLGGGRLLLWKNVGFSLVSARSGQVKWTDEKYGQEGDFVAEGMLEVHEGVLYFLSKRWESGEKYKKANEVVAYRLRDRKEIWKRKIPKSFAAVPESDSRDAGPSVEGGTLLIPNDPLDLTRRHRAYLGLSTRDGEKRRQREFREVGSDPNRLVRLAPGGLLLSGQQKGYVEARTLKTGAVRWRARIAGFASEMSAVWNGVLYVLNGDYAMYAFDLRTGRRKWGRPWPAAPTLMVTEAPALGAISLSFSGTVLLASSGEGVVALASEDGKLLWRFAAVAAKGIGPPSTDDSFGRSPGAVVARAPGMVVVNTLHDLYALPVD